MEERDYNHIPDTELAPYERQQVRRLWIERVWNKEARARRLGQLKIWASVFGVGASLFGIAASIRALWPWK